VRSAYAGILLFGSAIFAGSAAIGKAAAPKSNNAAIATLAQKALRSSIALFCVENSGDMRVLMFNIRTVALQSIRA